MSSGPNLESDVIRSLNNNHKRRRTVTGDEDELEEA